MRTLLFLLLPCSVLAQTAAPYPLQLWKDPTFKRQFLRGYGAATDIEPALNETEREQMQKLSGFMGEKPEACFKALLEVATPESTAEFDFVLGQLAVQLELPGEKAAGFYKTAIKKFPAFRRAHFALGRLMVQQNQFAAAVPSLSRAVELGQADATLMGLLAYCHLAMEQPASAETAYRNALVLQPQSVDWKMGLIRALLKQEKADEVIALCDEMIAADPDKADVWQLQSNAYLAKKDFLKAAANIELMAMRNVATAEDFQRLGDIYMNENMPPAALTAYGRALSLTPPMSLAAALRAVEVLGARGANDEARQFIGRVREAFGKTLADTDKRRLQKTEARIAVANGEAGEAVKILEEVVAVDPLDGEALMILAQHYGDAGEKERAILYYQRAGSITATEADAAVKHAQLLAGMSRLDEAIPLLKRAQSLKPREGVGKFLEELERYQKQRR